MDFDAVFEMKIKERVGKGREEKWKKVTLI